MGQAAGQVPAAVTQSVTRPDREAASLVHPGMARSADGCRVMGLRRMSHNVLHELTLSCLMQCQAICNRKCYTS